MSIISKINTNLIKFLEEHNTHQLHVSFDSNLRIIYFCENCGKSAHCKYKEILKREHQPRTNIQVDDGDISFSTNFTIYDDVAKLLVNKYNIQVSGLKKF